MYYFGWRSVVKNLLASHKIPSLLASLGKRDQEVEDGPDLDSPHQA